MENITEMLKGLLEGCVLEIISRGKLMAMKLRKHYVSLALRMWLKAQFIQLPCDLRKAI